MQWKRACHEHNQNQREQGGGVLHSYWTYKQIYSALENLSCAHREQPKEPVEGKSSSEDNLNYNSPTMSQVSSLLSQKQQYGNKMLLLLVDVYIS